MSSHHIVRDGQEPALIIANGQSCSTELLSQLLEWSPYTVVLDGALNRVADLAIHFDVVLGDFDSVAEKLMDNLPQKFEKVYTPNQDKTDLEKALEWLIDKKYTAANVVWGTGRRSDHHFHNMSAIAFYSAQIDAVMVDDHSRIFALKNSFQKKYPIGTILSLLPIGEVKNITTQNLQFPLNKENLSLPKRLGTSNCVNGNGMVKIEFETGHLLLIESND